MYRHAWKRAAILGVIYQQRSDQQRITQFKEFEKLASERYFKAAPDTLYGKARLKMGERTATRILEAENQRLFPTEGKRPHVRPLACIYIGTCERGRIYVGQTVGPPESRWVQHRFRRTGPFKKGEQFVEWKVVEGAIDLTKLDERESYYIGLFGADTQGYNDTKGNDWKAYERGKAERIRLNSLKGKTDADKGQRRHGPPFIVNIATNIAKLPELLR
jgi:GIY-YIG catalytic domain